jgi:hypothetical protein
MLRLVQGPFFGLAPNVLSLQVRPCEVKEPDEPVLGSPLTLARITTVIKAEVRANPFLAIVKGRISVL